jgi:glycosyltransferase involved in cell wall biosynthesis
MQLLVFAHTPPPLHGQSLMVQTLIEGLPRIAPQIRIFHVNPRLSHNAADIGRWRPAKVMTLLGAIGQALRCRIRWGPMVFYYVPAPGKRSSLWRDWLVMGLCRPFFSHLVLHWHAVGLGEWLATRATLPERVITRALLGRADMSIVLAPELAADAESLRPKTIKVVANGIDVPGGADASADAAAPAITPLRTRAAGTALEASRPTEIIFVGLCCREKGIFDVLTALAIANRREPDGFRLTVAGSFAHVRDQHAFFSQALALGPDLVRHVGVADERQKAALFARGDVFCFPSAYPHEGQPLVLLEALAHDLPIITTRWRAIPGMLPTCPEIQYVELGRPDQIAAALVVSRQAPAPGGFLRSHYLKSFTRGRHLHALADALNSVVG